MPKKDQVALILKVAQKTEKVLSPVSGLVDLMKVDSVRLTSKQWMLVFAHLLNRKERTIRALEDRIRILERAKRH